MIWWGWKLRNSKDYDYSSVYEILELKLSRMIECFEKDKFHKIPLKKIKVVRELANRLHKQEYLDNSLKLHEIRWGEHYYKSIGEISKYEECFRSSFKNVKNEMEEKQALKEYLALCRKSDRIELEEKNELFRLLSKYINHWWV